MLTSRQIIQIYTKDLLKHFSTNKPTFNRQDLKQKLSQIEYNVTQEKGTEYPFTGEYVNNKMEGIYNCKICDQALFGSEHKFDSQTGWPSFSDAVHSNIKLNVDNSHRMTRTEVVCANCDSHLGHVFEDGPKPTNKRYCINSVSLNFNKKI